MKCKTCGNERLFLVRGVCEVCLPSLSTIKVTKHGASRKGKFVVRLRKNIFYGGNKTKNHTVMPIESSLLCAKVYKSYGSACKIALIYGGTVEEVK